MSIVPTKADETPEQTYHFYGHNLPTAYGFGSYEDAVKYCKHLNLGKDINLYYIEPIENIQSDNIINLDDALACIDGRRD